MASFWDHYNSIFIDRVPYKYKEKPLFSSYAQSYSFKIKIRKITSSPQVATWNIQNPALKKHDLSFSKNCTLHGNIKISWIK